MIGSRLKKRKRLVLYWPWIYLRSGIERTVANYISRSNHNWTIYTNHFDREATFSAFRNFRVIELNRVPVDRNPLSALKAAFTIMLQRVNLSSFDALFLHSGDLGDLFAVRSRGIPVVCYCHSPIRPVYDPVYRSEYLNRNRTKAPLFWPLFAMYRSVAPVAWNRYLRVFCNSEWIRQRILTNRLAPPERIEVLHPGIDINVIRMSKTREHFFLVPGRIMWLKNIELAIQAFRIFNRVYHDGKSNFELVIAGMVDEKSQNYLKQLKRMSKGINRITFIVNPNDEELFSLYRRSYAIIFPPLAEDWGIVPLEAMASGKPVLAVNNGGPRESIVHEKTGMLLPPEAEAFSKAMCMLAENIPMIERMSVNARQHAESFDWSFFAERLDQFFEELPT